jgi:predicted Zn-dependent peptidase
MYQKSSLDNGLRILTGTMPHTRSVCLSVFIGAGSRYEEPDQAGVSHFVEHLCFKGTEKRATAKEISEAIEGVGGILNGGTDKESTVYWVKVARQHFPLALDVLVDIVCHSKFDPVEMEKERKVIIEELNLGLDFPPQRVNMLIDELLWPDQALGRDVLGTKQSIAALTRNMAVEYLSRQYRPSNAVVAVAGDISHDEVVTSVSQALADWPDGVPGPWYPVEDAQDQPRLQIEYKKTEQCHLCLAVRGLSLFHPDRFTLDLLNVILGEGMSSRLFVELRERRGLAYEVHSYVNHFLDSGAVVIYAGVEPRYIESAIEVILEELKRLKDEPPEQELVKAKELVKGRLSLRMEDSRSVSSWLGAQELLLKQIRTVDEVMSIVDGISPEELKRVGQNLLSAEKLSLAVVGPLRSEKRLHRLLKL